MKKQLAFVALLAISVFAAVEPFAQINLEDTVSQENAMTRSANAGFAEEEFRRGVQSYYRGAFMDSILSFERALSYLPGETLILDWLGKAYYRAGLEGTALQQWNFAQELGYGGLLLQNKIEIVSERRANGTVYGASQRYTESGSFSHVNGNTLIYSQPISVLPNDDGSIWVVAYGSNELLRFNVNGEVIRRSGGPVNGLDRPMDIVRLSDGNLLVSECSGDRLCLLNEDGFFIKTIGKKGRGEGELIGPQYLALDSFGNIYVTDFGNARVVVFDPDGNGLLHFGQPDGFFPGFKSPTGIAIIDDRIFVADSISGSIYEFDRAGNYHGQLVPDHTFSRPESMKTWGQYIILTDRNRVVTVDSLTGATYENAKTGNGKTQITSAVPDRNGNIIVTDFKANEIYIMANLTEVVGGYFVQIERVIADNFPTVILEVRVENRHRQQIVGLNQTNFFVTENKRAVADFQLLGAADNNGYADITLIIDRNVDMAHFIEPLQSAVREIASSMNEQANLQIIAAGDIPVKVYEGNASKAQKFTVSMLSSVPYSEDPILDRAIRLAVNETINGEKKRGVIYLTAGGLGQNAFSSYGLSDLTAYLNNNAISFSTINLSQGSLPEEVEYIAKNANGQNYYVYRPQGLSDVVADITALPSGLYQMQYVSALPKEYGRKYLPVEVETYLLNKSGRDESGYFAPLD